MIMENVDFMNKRGKIRYYTTLDMVISEHNSDNVKNQNALKDYRELYDLLKKENELQWQIVDNCKKMIEEGER